MWAHDHKPSPESSQKVLGTNSHGGNSKGHNYSHSHDYISVLWGLGSSKDFTVPTGNHLANGPTHQKTNHMSSVATPPMPQPESYGVKKSSHGVSKPDRITIVPNCNEFSIYDNHSLTHHRHKSSPMPQLTPRHDRNSEATQCT